MICHAAPSRVGILGNPSDGYGGRTLALAVPQFAATVELEPSDGVDIVGLRSDEYRWNSIGAMVDHVDRYGYGTGPQLLAATVRTFIDVVESVGHVVGSGFRLSYATTIPRQVGLGGSSALVVAALRCLCEHFSVDIPDAVLPSIALRTETTQLGVAAGLQDRVVQTYGGLVAMDFGHDEIDTRFGVTYGSYERVDPTALPPLFLAYRESSGEPSTAYHSQLRQRFDAGDPVVREAMRELAALVVEGRAALRWGDASRFTTLIGRNMTLRATLGPLPPAQLELVDVAEAFGARATFAGSGGAIVGAFADRERFQEAFEPLSDAYADIGADVVRLESTAPDAAPAADADEPTANVVRLPPRSS